MSRRLVSLLLLCLLLASGCTSYTALRYAQKAQLAFAQESWEEAARLYYLAFEDSPKHADYLYNQLLSLLYAKSYDSVIEESENAIKAFPAYLEFLLLEARAYTLKQDYGTALSVYEAYREANPGSYSVQAEVMNLALEWGETSFAIQLAQRLIDIPGTSEQALKVLAAVEGKESWPSYLLEYLTREKPAQDPEQSPTESNTADAPS